MVALLVVLVVTVDAIVYIAFRRRNPAPHNRLALRGTPLTTFPGSELDPALSPDGNSVAFCWNGEKEDNLDIYVLHLAREDPRSWRASEHRRSVHCVDLARLGREVLT